MQHQSNSEDDSSTGVSPGGVYAIYMEDEEVWTGVDQEVRNQKLEWLSRYFAQDYCWGSVRVEMAMFVKERTSVVILILCSLA